MYNLFYPEIIEKEFNKKKNMIDNIASLASKNSQ